MNAESPLHGRLSSVQPLPFMWGRRYEYGALVLITLLATILRFYKLGEWSFWGDEVISVGDAMVAFEEPSNVPHTTLFLIGAALNWLGTSEWSARIVPAMIGIISIPILYMPIRKMVGPAVALLASFLLAVSPWHLYWSQNARFYTTILFFYTLAILTFYFWLEEDQPLYLLLSLTMAALAANERLFALFYVPVVFSYLVLLAILPIQKPLGLKPSYVILAIIISVGGAVYLAAPFLRAWSLWTANFGRLNSSPFWIIAGTTYYVRLPIMCLGFAGLLYLLFCRKREGLLLGLSAFIPLIATAFISLVQYAANRYVFISITSWLILASIAVVTLIRDNQGMTRILAAGVVLLVLLDPLAEDLLYFRYQHGNRDDWKSAYQLIDRHRLPSDIVVTSNMDTGDYYLQSGATDLYSTDLSQLENSNTRSWFIIDMNVAELAPEKLRWLENNAVLIANLDVHVQARNFMMRIYLYEPRPS